MLPEGGGKDFLFMQRRMGWGGGLRETVRRINTHTFHDYYPARKYVVILCCRNTSYNSGKHSQSPAEPRKAWILQADGRPQSQCVTPPQSVSETTPPTIRLYSPII